MPMLKPRRRITKKQMKQDKLVTSTFKAVEYVQEHSRTLTIGLVAIIAVLIIGFLIVNSRKQRELKAASQLGRAQLVYQSGDYEGAIHLFEPILHQYGGAKSAGQATFFTANCYFFTENFDQALEYYDQYVEKYSDVLSFTASASAGAAACYEEKGDYSEAARRYEKAATQFEDFFQAPEYLLSAGRCYEMAGDATNARRVYQNIIDLYPDSKFLQQAKLTLTELES